VSKLNGLKPNNDIYVWGRRTLVLTINTIPTKCTLQYYLHHVNNSHLHVEFVISIISNLNLHCSYHDGVDWKGN